MRKHLALWIGLIPLIAFAQEYKRYTVQKDKLSIQLSEGILNISPLSDKVIRIQWVKNSMKETQEFVLINKPALPDFKITETPLLLKLSTNKITVEFNKQNGAIHFINKSGKVFLSEKAGTRKCTLDVDNTQ